MFHVMLLAAVVAPAVPPKAQDRFIPTAFDRQKVGGYLALRMQVNLEKRLLQIEEEALLAGFRNRPGSHPWIGEHIGKYLDAAANAVELTRNEALREQMTRMASELVKTQLDDGYLGTYADDRRWTSWDVWVHKYDLIGLLASYRITGDERLLGSARRVGDLLARTFGDSAGKRDIIAASTHVGMAATSVLEPMVRLYTYTGERRYLDFCRYILRAWEQPNGPKLLSSLLAHGNVARTANGKAYEMMSDLVGLAELYRATGEAEYLNSAQIAQADIAARRLYITGTTSTHEHFQDDLVLPGELVNDVGEGCATVTWLQLNWQLLRLTGEARYAEMLERTVFNQLLAAQEAATGEICYFTPLNGKKQIRGGINCCKSSEPRGISMIPQLLWGELDGAPVIWIYAPGEFRTAKAGIEVETDFPASGSVRITVKDGGRFPIYVRRPSWARTFRGAAGPEKDGLVRIEREWKSGDRIELEMEMTVRAVDGGKSYPGFTALMRGPQVLALDRGDNAGVPYLFRAGWKDASPRLAADLTARGVFYDGAKMRETRLKLRPFADAADYRVWLAQPGRVSSGPVAKTAFGRESSSSRGAGGHGSICDERTDLDRRTAAGGAVWFAVELRDPAMIGRIVAVRGGGGWFDGGAKVEVQARAGDAWTAVGTLGAGESELRLPAPVRAAAVRLSGTAAAPVSLSELAAY